MTNPADSRRTRLGGQGPYRDIEPHKPEKRIQQSDAIHFAVDGSDIEWILSHSDENYTLNYIEFVVYLRTRRI